jgi:hypothetical protein
MAFLPPNSDVVTTVVQTGKRSFAQRDNPVVWVNDVDWEIQVTNLPWLLPISGPPFLGLTLPLKESLAM